MARILTMGCGIARTRFWYGGCLLGSREARGAAAVGTGGLERTIERMLVKRHKAVEGRKRCDFCQKSDVGALSEVQVAIHGGKNPFAVPCYWMIVCSDCQRAIEGLPQGEGIEGFEMLQVAQSTVQPPVKRHHSGKGSSDFNVYGPRPETFHCKDCETEDRPLFGHSVVSSPSDETRCGSCLIRYMNREKRIMRLTPDAELAWKAVPLPVL